MPPGVKQGEVVLAYEEHEFHARIQGIAQGPKGEGGEGWLGAGGLDLGDLESGQGGRRKAAHVDTVLCGRRMVLGAVDGRCRGNEEEGVETEEIAGVLGGNQVPQVDGIERAAKDADPLHEGSMGQAGADVKFRRGKAMRIPVRTVVAWAFVAGAVIVLALGGWAWAAGDGQGGSGPGQAPGAAPGVKGPDIKFVEEEDDEGAGKSTPKNPFGAEGNVSGRKDAVPGYVELSTGLKVPARIFTTRGKRLKIFNLKREAYEYVPVPALTKIEAVVEWERVDKEWRFKEAGNPEKVYTGRSYPARQLAWRLTLRNNHEILGHVLGQPLYAEHNGKVERFILHKRDKGAMGGELKDLLYIKSVEFGADAYNQAVDELKAKAEAAPPKAGAGAAPRGPAK